MPRKHAFLITVLLGAVFFVGVVAVSRTVLLGQPAEASTASDPAIAFRMRKLARLEASLERDAAGLRPPQKPAQVTVYRRASSGAAPIADAEPAERAESPDD
jgi:hypothetical protein